MHLLDDRKTTRPKLFTEHFAVSQQNSPPPPPPPLASQKLKREVPAMYSSISKSND